MGSVEGTLGLARTPAAPRAAGFVPGILLSRAGKTCHLLAAMQRALILHGPVPQRIAQLALRVAARAGVSAVHLATAGQDPEQELSKLLASGEPVVATVDSEVLRGRALRLESLRSAVLVAATARPDVVAAECGISERQAERAGELDERARIESHLQCSVDGDLDEVADEVVQLWRRDPLLVATGDRSYRVEVGRGMLGLRVAEAVADAPLVLVVTDGNVEGLHLGKVTEPITRSKKRLLGHVMRPGERSKIVRTIVQIWNVALEGGADRTSVFVGLGGGVVTDVTGFAAATWMRGVRWVCAPTTLLAMVDASVGGKTGVDLRAAKNAVGSFWQPGRVICDMDTLQTEPRRGFVSALAEVVKTALIGDSALLDLVEAEAGAVLARDPKLLEDIVRRCIAVKADVVSRDEREGGLRAVLNLGHTVGHALEAKGEYVALTHGEAVSLGLVAALRMGVRLGVTPESLSERVVRLLERLELPTNLWAHDLAGASELLGHDKKRAGDRLRFVVARDVGRVETISLDLGELRDLARGVG